MAAPILILQPERLQPPAYLGDWLARRGLDTVTLLLRDTANLPGPGLRARCGGLVLLGADTNAGDPRWQRALTELLQTSHTAGRPLLALGAGMAPLCTALGGETTPAGMPVRGWFPLALHPAAAEPPWITRFDARPPPAFCWQTFTVRPPPTAITLYSGAHARCQAFVDGSALALGFHPHLQSADYVAWLSAAPDWAPPSATVQPITELLASGAARIAAQRRFADACFEAWLALW